MRAAEILAVGGVLAGAAWWMQREHQRERVGHRTALRVAELLEARALAGLRPAQGEERVAAGEQGSARALPTGAVSAMRAAPTSPTSAPARPAPVATASGHPPASVPDREFSVLPSHREDAPPLTRAFDPIFRAEGRGLPVAYLRALAHAESRLTASARLGLISVVPVALDDYNRRHPGARVEPGALRDPVVNVRVAADILRTIIASYRQHHPDVRNLVEDWRNPRFVELLTTGWNAGYSERGGVGRVVRYLQARPVAAPGADELTVDAVFAAAAKAGATRHLSNPARLAFAKSVARTYLREAALDGARVS